MRESTLSDKDKLNEMNWAIWSKRIIPILKVCQIQRYIYRTIKWPDLDANANVAATWDSNEEYAKLVLLKNIQWAQKLLQCLAILHCVMPQGLSYVPRVYLYLYSAIYVSRLLMCTTGPPYCSYQTFPLSRYLAALDLLTRHGSPAYLGCTSHARAAPSTHTYLHCFWHA